MAIVFNHVSFSYRGKSFSGAPLFDSLSVSFEANKIIGIVGPSGCGKSTILKLICGLLKPTGGSIAIDEGDVEGARTSGSFGIVFQQPDLLPWRTLSQNLKLPFEINKNKYDEAAQEEILGRTGLETWRNKYPHELSGGMQQRAALARALVCNPRILLLDEPFSQLDELLRFDLLFYVYERAKNNNSTVIFVTHDITEAVIACDEIYILSNNKKDTIKKVGIDLPPRSFSIVEDRKFQNYVLEVRQILRNQL